MDNLSLKTEKSKILNKETECVKLITDKIYNRNLIPVENLEINEKCFSKKNKEERNNSIIISNNYLMECSSFDSKLNFPSILNSPLINRSQKSFSSNINANEKKLNSPISLEKLDLDELPINKFKNRFKSRFKNDNQKVNFLIKLHDIKKEENQNVNNDLSFKIKENNSVNFEKKDNKLYFEQNDGVDDFNLYHLNGLYKILIKIFKNENIIENDLKLKKEELNILNYILKRKYNKKMTKKELILSSNKQIVIIKKILKTISRKRPEECYKFIFSRVVKYLKKKTDFKHHENFYTYYFKEISDEFNIPLLDFNYPFKKSSKKNYKAFNGIFFGHVFSSKKFKEDFLNYIENIFVEKYKKEIEKKNKMILFKWDRKFKDKRNMQIILPKIKNYLLKNKKSKLPWNLKEVNMAILRMVSIAKNSITLKKS